VPLSNHWWISSINTSDNYSKAVFLSHGKYDKKKTIKERKSNLDLDKNSNSGWTGRQHDVIFHLKLEAELSKLAIGKINFLKIYLLLV